MNFRDRITLQPVDSPDSYNSNVSTNDTNFRAKSKLVSKWNETVSRRVGTRKTKSDKSNFPKLNGPNFHKQEGST